jgi:hypothetical protein
MATAAAANGEEAPESLMTITVADFGGLSTHEIALTEAAGELIGKTGSLALTYEPGQSLRICRAKTSVPILSYTGTGSMSLFIDAALVRTRPERVAARKLYQEEEKKTKAGAGPDDAEEGEEKAAPAKPPPAIEPHPQFGNKRPREVAPEAAVAPPPAKHQAVPDAEKPKPKRKRSTKPAKPVVVLTEAELRQRDDERRKRKNAKSKELAARKRAEKELAAMRANAMVPGGTVPAPVENGEGEDEDESGDDE